jgi:hypothetical protein
MSRRWGKVLYPYDSSLQDIHLASAVRMRNEYTVQLFEFGKFIVLLGEQLERRHESAAL